MMSHYEFDSGALWCGDAKECLATLPDSSVDAIVSDPPSGTNMLLPFRESCHKDPARVMDFDAPLGKLRANFKTTHQINLRSRAVFQQDVWPVLGECARVLKPGGYGIFWGLQRTAHWLSWGLEDAGLSVLDILARRVAVQRMKSPIVNGRYSTQVARETEFWILVRKPGSEPTAAANREKWGTGYMDHGQSVRLTNLIEGFPVNRHTTKHPAEKSLKWMETLVQMVTPAGGVVLDPFMGSGTTGVAAISSGLRFLGSEKDSTWYEIAKQRISESKRPT